MPKRGSKWSPEELSFLKQLRESQIALNMVSWSDIANRMNEKFPKSFRNPQRCRDKFINSIQIQENSDSTKKWTKQEQQFLGQLYMKHGPCWNYFASIIRTKSQNCIKNRFNILLRRLCKALKQVEGRFIKQWKKSITFEMLLAMIDFSNQIRKTAIKMQLTLNQQSKIFRFRSKIISFIFQNNQQPSDQELLSLIKLMKILNSKIRCYGIFKTKNRKNYKFQQKSLYSIYLFDKVVKQELSKPLQKTQIKQKENYQQLVQQRDYDVQIEEQLDCQQNLNIPGVQDYFQLNKNQIKRFYSWKHQKMIDIDQISHHNEDQNESNLSLDF